MSKYQGWKWEPILKHIEGYQSGIASGEKSRETGFPHLRMNNISTRFTLNLDEMWYIPISGEEKKKYSLKKGDLLFNNTNSAELVGKSCIFEIDTDIVYLFSNHITRIRTKETLSSLYLLYWIKSLWEKQYFKENCTKWVNQAAARPEDLLFTKEIFLPPTKAEQEDIACNLQSQLARIENMRQAALNQKEAAKALQSAILREAFPWCAGDALPAGWRWEKLGTYARFKNGLNYSSSDIQSGIKVVGVSCFQDNFFLDEVNDVEIRKEKVREQDFLKKNDILIVRSNGSAELVGRHMLYVGDEKVTHSGFTIRLRLEDTVINPLFYMYFAKSDFFKSQTRGQGANINNVSQKKLASVNIPLPKTIDQQLSVVNRIKCEFETTQKLLSSTTRQLSAIEALPAAILRETFNFEN